MNKLRKISRKYYLRQIVACWTVYSMLFFIPIRVVMADINPSAGALPSGESIAAGSVGNFNRDTLNQLHLENVANGTIINWDNFDIGSEALTEFQQLGGANSAVLNRVTDGVGTGIMGSLTANGRVFIINPAGIVFGSGAYINVSQLVASSLKLDDADFLNGSPYEFTDGFNAGDVTNNACIDGESIERIALIGRNVCNYGDLKADKYVVMAAGNTVLLTENGTVTVDVTDLSGWNPDVYSIYQVRNEGGGIDVEGENAQVVLAAGDVWSMAYIGALSEGGSDAVATVDIDAAGDVVIEDDIIAEAGVDWSSGFDATATITIDAGGNVEVIPDSHCDATVGAMAQGGVNNDADVTITAGDDVKVKAEHGSMAYIQACAGMGTNNTSDVTITAGDDVKVKAEDGGQAYILANTGMGTNNTADVTIGAGGDVEVKAIGWGSGPVSMAGICAGAGMGTNNTAGVDITAGGNVEVLGRDGGDARIESMAQGGVNNDADVTITTEDGYVKVLGIGYKREGSIPSHASIGAMAEGAEKENTANVTITANSDGCEDCDKENLPGDVAVVGVMGGEAEIEAIAEGSPDNSADVTINADNRVKVIALGYGSGPASEAEIMALAKNEGSYEYFPFGGPVQLAIALNGDLVEPIVDATIDGIVNTANVDITALQVEVRGENHGEAEIEAVAKNEIEIPNYQDSIEVTNLTVKNVQNNADVTLTVNGGDATEDYETGDVLVTATEGGKAKIGAKAENKLVSESYDTVNLTLDGAIDNTADVTINAADDVEVTANLEGSRSVAEIEVEAKNEIVDEPARTVYLTVNGLNTNAAGIDITAADNVLAEAENGGIASIEAKTENEIEIYTVPEYAGAMENSSTVKIDAGGSVMVEAIGWGSGPESIAEIEAEAQFGTANTADIDIDAGCNVEVKGEDGGTAEVKAEAMFAGMIVLDPEPMIVGGENKAGVNITAGSDVKVEAIGWGSGPASEASIEALAEEGLVSNTADVTIVAGGNVEVTGKEGGRGRIPLAQILAEADPEVTIIDDSIEGPDNTATIAIDAGGNVLVHGEHGDGFIEAIAHNGSTNSADVSIDADGDVEVKASGCEAAIKAEASEGSENNATVTLGTLDGQGNRQRIGGDVLVTSELGEAYISALSQDMSPFGEKNTSNVLVCTNGSVEVTAGSDEQGGGPSAYAGITACAVGGSPETGTINTANVGIGAKEGVDVIAKHRGSAAIEAVAFGGYTTNADVVVCTEGDVRVIDICRRNIDEYDGVDAEISAIAMYGYTNDAYVGVGAKGDIIVAAGIDIDGDGGSSPSGGQAAIRTEAGMYQGQVDYEGSYANATTVAVSKNGGVLVVDSTSEKGSGSAGIIAEAHDTWTNTASVGVAAGADLSPEAVMTEDALDVFSPGDVYVIAQGPYSDARIMSHAYGAYGEGSSNTADTVVCAPGEVFVTATGEGSEAKIKSFAGQPWDKESLAINSATTQVYASEVKVDVPGLYRGNGISAWAVGSDLLNVGVSYCLTEDDAVALTDGGSTLIIDTYANKNDCPTCPPCPCEEVGLSAAAAPLPVIETPRVEGCPALMLAASLELGIAGEPLQVAIGNALALNPSLQPCGASASLLNAANILRDEDGSRMAALNQAFNNLAPANTPMTPEMEASIAMAFDNAPEGSQNALAKEYVDAFVEYASVLDNQLGSPTGDSMAFVMGKYGAGVTESANNNVATYVVSRLQGI